MSKRVIEIKPRLVRRGLLQWVVTVEEYVGDTEDGKSEIWAQSKWFFDGIFSGKEAFRFAAHYRSAETESPVEHEERINAKRV